MIESTGRRVAVALRESGAMSGAVAEGGPQPARRLRPAARRPVRPPLRLYTVPCPQAFRADVLDLAARRGVTPAALVKAALDLVDPAFRAALPDPGDPAPADCRPVVYPLAGGRSRTVLRPPTLKLLLPGGLEKPAIRRALAAALALSRPDRFRLLATADLVQAAAQVAQMRQRLAELEEAFDTVAFRPFQNGVTTLRQAAHVLGFVELRGLDTEAVNQRFRRLARFFHTDTGVSTSGQRMVQLIEARKLLCDHLRSV